MAKGKVKTTIVFSLILLLGIASAGAMYFFQVFYKSPYFLPGVKIASTKVGGYTSKQAVSRLQQDLDAYKNIPVVFYYQDHSFENTLAEISYAIDYEDVVNRVWQQEQKRDWTSKLSNMDGSQEVFYPMKLEYKPEIKAQMIDEWNKVLGVGAEDARLEIDREKGLVLIPARKGLKVDTEQTFAKLPQEWGAMESIEIPIIIQEEWPRVKDEDLSNMGELASFSTWYNANEINRSHNLYLATAAINTSMLVPGETFSFNQWVGERVIEAGYRDAMVIVNGKFEPGLGGGVCQVSSTLYNAVLLAGLEIVERHNHALAVAYVPVGRDATVAYGLQDFRFKNNSAYPIYIRAWAQAGKLTMNIYGNLTEKRKIRLSTITDRVIAFKEIRQNEPSLNPGQEKVDHAGIQGYVVRSFRSFMDEEGRVVKSEQLASDYYKPLDKLIYVGPSVTVESPPENPDNSENPENEIEPDAAGDGTGEAPPLVEPEPPEVPIPLPENEDEDTPPITI
ncbi:MAG: VanW family protein [Syntrophomonas sp.]|uniref:VanW family protein n=1 Tax=Syntrophomonas sp. TaxID=2053627 RepID=UPI00261CEE86|nr:VanW family protein [Syntrophomonas sp.]MDD2510600.1 VanW family protein [Syntrophomonas sp.]MDD3878690.1 VanW family protein [Syntrophomonas sp.]MDD4626174.1 VanW family protein [Syntrophomonas sp.]